MSDSSKQREKVGLLITNPDIRDSGAEILAHAYGLPERDVVRALQGLRARNEHLATIANAASRSNEAKEEVLRYKRLVRLLEEPLFLKKWRGIRRQDLYMHEWFPNLARLCAILAPESDFQELQGLIEVGEWKYEKGQWYKPSSPQQAWEVRPLRNKERYNFQTFEEIAKSFADCE